MRDNKLHTPDGMKDFLIEECSYKQQLEKRIESVFQRYGYMAVSSPTLEFMEVFEGKGSISPKQMYKFIDRDGEILTLRSDMTPPIARIAATNFTKEDIPLRFYYIENVYRYNESYQGKSREHTQAGVELIGIDSDDATAEVIALAINSLLSTGLEDFKIYIGDVEFFKSVLEEAGLKADIACLSNYIINQNFVSYEQHIKASPIPDDKKALILKLPFLIGNIEIVKKTKKTVSQMSYSAIERLEEIYSILECYGLQDYVLFDLGMVGHLDYYSGIIFRGYTYGTGFSILDGGRYDNLISQYGEVSVMGGSSVGFAIKINDLLASIQNQNIKYDISRADTLLVYEPAGRKTALETADELRTQGLSIENSLFTGIEKNIEYAARKQFGGILYFKDSENISVIDVATRTERKVRLSELVPSELEGAAE